MKYLLLILLVFVQGCTLFTQEVIREVPVHARIACTDPPFREGLDLKPVNWQIATINDTNVLALDGQNYSNLGINFERIVEYIQIQNLVIIYYQQCIDTHNKKGEQ